MRFVKPLGAAATICSFVLGLDLGISASEVPAASAPLAHDVVYGVDYEGANSADGEIEYFHGIYFAQDTAGVNRFAPPKPRQPPVKGSVVDATTPAPACAQAQIPLPPIVDTPSAVSENCLSLMIARPAGVSNTSLLPVLVWSYGAGVVHGTAEDTHTNPEKLIKLSVDIGQPVIYASISYRLSIFGFAASDTLHQQRSLNNGIRDQLAAFEWLKEHVASFGGDPERMTAFGVSAGATLTSLHQVAFAGERGLPYSQTFLMSGPYGTAINQTSDAVHVHTAAVAQKLGCRTSGQKMLDCMRDVPMPDLINTAYSYAQAHHPPLGMFTFIPTVDGDLLPDKASTLIRQGKFVKNIPTILAWTEDDGASNVGPGHLIQTEEDFLAGLSKWTTNLLTESELSELKKVYPLSDFEDATARYNDRRAEDKPHISPQFFRLAAFLRDLLFACSGVEYGSRLYAQTRATVNKDFDNVFFYQFNQSLLAPMYAAGGMDYIKAPHGSDVNYAYNGVFPQGKLSRDDLELARTFAASIINFAYTGRPVSNEPSRGTFDSWPSAFEGVSSAGVNLAGGRPVPTSLNLLVMGGPHGNTPVQINFGQETSRGMQEQADSIYGKIVGGLYDLQQNMVGSFDLGGMPTPKAAMAKQQIESQKILQRCNFVNTLTDSMMQ